MSGVIAALRFLSGEMVLWVSVLFSPEVDFYFSWCLWKQCYRGDCFPGHP